MVKVAMLLVILACYLARVASGGQICGSCTKLIEPKYCNLVAECGAHEYCSVQRYLLRSTIRYDIGCRSQDYCDIQPVPAGRRSNSDGRYVQCVECCNNTALCNTVNGLCGSSSLQYSMDRISLCIGLETQHVTLCYACAQMRGPRDCDQITLCGRDHHCYIGQKEIHFTADKIWESRCSSNSSECTSARGSIVAPVIGKRESRVNTNGGLCSACCRNSHLCNKDCYLNPVQPTHTTLPTTTAAAATPTTSISSITLTTTTTIPRKSPHITAFFHPDFVHLGSNLTLVCEAEGYPTPTIEWLILSSNGLSHTPNNVRLESNHQHLVIQNFRTENYGHYGCRAFNVLGEDTRQTALRPH